MSMPVQLPPFFRGEAYDIVTQSVPWTLSDQELPEHWTHTDGGTDVIGAVLDTGIDEDHPEFEHGCVLESRSFVRRQSAKDGNGHGTFCASMIAGKSVGVAPRCKLIIGKVLGDNGSGSTTDIQEALRWCLAEKVNFVSMSFGSPQPDRGTEALIRSLQAEGIICLAASGNERSGRVGYPSGYCISVGAVDRQLRIARFSNRGVKLDCVGYGVDTPGAVPGGSYARWSGTSMATPWVAGIAANRLSAELAAFGEIRTTTQADLLSFATDVFDLGRSGRDKTYGYGFPDCEKLFYKGLTDAAPKREPLKITIEGARSGLDYETVTASPI